MTPVAPEPVTYLDRRAGHKRRRVRRIAAAGALVIGAAVVGIGCSTDRDGRVKTGGPGVNTRPIRADSIVAATRHSLLELGPNGSVRRELATLASDESFEGLSLHPDRLRVFASVIRPDPGRSSNCRKQVVEIRTDGSRRVVADGNAPAVSLDGSRLAFVRLERVSDVCYRTAIVVRDLGDDVDSVYELPARGIPDGTPPELPLAWSPAGGTIAFVDNDGARLLDLSATDRTETRPLPTATSGERLLLPTFLNAQEVLAVTGCCAGPGRAVKVNLTDGRRADFLRSEAAVVSMTPRNGASLLFVTAAQRLFVSNGSRQQLLREGIVAADASRSPADRSP